MSSNGFNSVKKISAQDIDIFRDTSGILKVKIKSENIEYPAKPVRCFPFTEAERYLGLYKLKPEGTIGEEIALIADVHKLDRESRQLIEEELNKAYSLTWIKRIHSVEQTKKTSKWRVNTDKGEQTFEVEYQKDIYMIQPTLVAIEDIKGNIFLIDPTRLDPKSLSLLEIYR